MKTFRVILVLLILSTLLMGCLPGTPEEYDARHEQLAEEGWSSPIEGGISPAVIVLGVVIVLVIVGAANHSNNQRNKK